MKKARTSLIFLFALCSLLLFDSCSKKDDPAPTPLTANAGTDQTVAPFTTVTLDGSSSIGEGSINYEWKYTGSVPENEIAFTNKNDKTTTFIPPKNGAYSFTLRITSGTQFSEDNVTVTVTGVLTLPTSITTAFTLKDVEPDPTKPDYTATGITTIATGGSISMPQTSTNGIVIDFAEAGGLEIQAGNVILSTVVLTSANGWKGILLSGGNLTINTSTRLEKAGKSVLTGQTETAAIVVTGGTLNSVQSSFTGTLGTYDILITGGSSQHSVSSTTFSTMKPLKMPIAYLGNFQGNQYPAGYEYLTLTTPGASTTVSPVSITGFVFHANTKFYIDGDFTAGGVINFQGGSTIYMKAGAGILLSGNSAGTAGSGATLDGLNGAPWKGIAVGGGAQFSISNLTIKNAGSDLFNTGSFNSLQKAAIYYSGINNGVISNCQIIDSKGYGVSIDGPPNNYVTISGTTFTNPASPAIRGLVNVIDQVIANTPNTYTMSAGVAAVEVLAFNPTTYQPKSTWQALGGNNFYLITGNIFAGTAWTLAPGVNLKFKAGKSLDVQGGLFTAIGTAQAPITFDSEAGTAGSWPGIVIESNYKIEFCQIKNGGESLLFKGGVTPATEKANIVFNNFVNAANTFKNNTISGSAGYGILVEATKQNPDALNVANSNTFSANTSGSVIVK